jgi:hypothetical protein
MSDDDSPEARLYRRSLWGEVERHLSAAVHSIGLAQGVLEDLHRSDYADQLQPLADQLRAASTEAAESA